MSVFVAGTPVRLWTLKYMQYERERGREGGGRVRNGKLTYPLQTDTQAHFFVERMLKIAVVLMQSVTDIHLYMTLNMDIHISPDKRKYIYILTRNLWYLIVIFTVRQNVRVKVQNNKQNKIRNNIKKVIKENK